MADTNLMCRAKCETSETAAHVIQGCVRTHGGRIKRHDAIVKTLDNIFRQKGFKVLREPRIQTSIGLQKPDLIIIKDKNATIVDTQIVSGATSLAEAHIRKVKKYSSSEIKEAVGRREEIEIERIRTTSCTLSWRGIWAKPPAEDLIKLGVTKNALGGIVTRVLQGSHMNWNQFNKMTTTIWEYRRIREGVG